MIKQQSCTGVSNQLFIYPEHYKDKKPTQERDFLFKCINQNSFVFCGDVAIVNDKRDEIDSEDSIFQPKNLNQIYAVSNACFLTAGV